MTKWGFTAGSRLAIAMLLTLSVGLAIVGCGGSGPVDKGAVTLTIPVGGSPGIERTPERLVLTGIYAQALRASGYRVKMVHTEDLDGTSPEALISGQIAGYPDHLSSTLYYGLEVGVDEMPTDAHAAYEKVKGDLEKRDLTAFPPTPFGISNAVGMLRQTAEREGLKTDSDLKGKAEKMTIKAPTYCHVSQECLGGIELYYHTAFEAVSYEDASSAELRWFRPEPNFLYQVLENGASDASMLFTTDGRLAAEKGKFVVLEDDKHAFPAGNVVWVTSPAVVDEAGPDYEKAIVRAQKGLTLETMRDLNAEVELEKKPATKVAAEYLKSIDYAG